MRCCFVIFITNFVGALHSLQVRRFQAKRKKNKIRTYGLCMPTVCLPPYRFAGLRTGPALEGLWLLPPLALLPGGFSTGAAGGVAVLADQHQPSGQGSRGGPGGTRRHPSTPSQDDSGAAAPSGLVPGRELHQPPPGALRGQEASRGTPRHRHTPRPGAYVGPAQAAALPMGAERRGRHPQPAHEPLTHS